MVQAAGFWSYTHADDADSGGRIRRLADLVSSEYRLSTGAKLDLFVDRSSLEWGDAWQDRIDEALLKTTFFIPIVTPQFFLSEQCRRELLTFIGHARRLGLEELLLPILYAGPTLREEDATDEPMALIARTQWEDWRDLRLEDEDSSAHRKGVRRLVQRLADVAERLSETPVVVPREDSDGEEEEEEEEDALGLIDLIAQGEEAMPEWTETITQLGQATLDFGDVVREWTPRLEQLGARGAPTSAKLSMLRRVSNDLGEPATRIEELGRQYAAALVRVDPGILSLLSLWEERGPDRSGEETEAAEMMFASILDMVAKARTAMASLDGFIASLEPISRMSRDMRKPIRKARAGLRNVSDGQSVLEDWAARIEALQADDEAAGSAGGEAAGS